MRSFWTNAISAAASVALTAGIVAFATPAFADVGAAPQVKISFDHNDVGSVALDRRIRLAASWVCDTDEANQGLAEAQCRTQAIRQAKSDLATQVSLNTVPAIELAAR